MSTRGKSVGSVPFCLYADMLKEGWCDEEHMLLVWNKLGFMGKGQKAKTVIDEPDRDLCGNILRVGETKLEWIRMFTGNKLKPVRKRFPNSSVRHSGTRGTECIKGRWHVLPSDRQV